MAAENADKYAYWANFERSVLVCAQTVWREEPLFVYIHKWNCDKWNVDKDMETWSYTSVKIYLRKYAIRLSYVVTI